MRGDAVRIGEGIAGVRDNLVFGDLRQVEAVQGDFAPA
jgi:hypothetical protein